MYARPKLPDSVSVEELLTMRECGLGNAEIAKRLDTSPATIYKYIGKQPKELNKPTGYRAHKAKQDYDSMMRQRKEDAEARKKAEALWNEKLEAAMAEQAEAEARAVTVDEDEHIDIFGVTELPEKKPCPAVFTCDADMIQPWEGGLKVISRITHAESDRARYTVDTQNGTVKVGHKNLATNEIYDEGSLQKYIDELAEVLAMLKK